LLLNVLQNENKEIRREEVEGFKDNDKEEKK
jgi:hypothetical protein